MTTIGYSEPAAGTSYIVGKSQLEKLIADRAVQLGEKFRLKDFFDDYFARGVIPASLLRWEMTGRDDEMQMLWNMEAMVISTKTKK